MAKLPKNILTTSEYLSERAISHAIYLERFKTQEVNQLFKIYDDEIAPEIMKLLNRHVGTGTVTEARIKRLAKALSSYTKTAESVLYDKLKKEMADFSLVEAKSQTASISSAAPIDIQVDVPDARVLKGLVNTRPMDGLYVNEWFADWGMATSKKIIKEVRIGAGLGEGIEKITRRILGTKSQGYKDGIINEQRRHVRTLVRTTVANVSNEVRNETYKANEDVIKGVEIVATLDSRTSAICRAEDGNVYPVDSGPRPPFHPNCRTTTVPVLKSWRELGVKLKEAPTGTRASMDGQVSSRKTYGQWLKEQPKSRQEDILGKRRTQLFRAGKVKIDQFVDYRGDPLTLKQLEKKYA